jgi:sialate O-acetylesterase
VSCLGFFLLSTAAGASAEVKLPNLISDHMVLQQGMKVRIWGTAAPGEKVSVAFRDQKIAAEAGPDGQWQVHLEPLKAGGPDEMTVAGSNTIVLKNVLVGEVWVCSGQSNMWWPVSNSLNAREEIAAAQYPLIRLFTVAPVVAGKPQRDVDGLWAPASPESVAKFSAVGYFFGRALHKALSVPVGLIHSSWGGTPAESWTTRATLDSLPEVTPFLKLRDQLLPMYALQVQEFKQKYDDWLRAADQAEAEGKIMPAAPRPPDDPRGSAWRPGALYNAMIAPLVLFAIRGAIWYQGESNADRAVPYRKLFPAMIQDWRRAWGEGDFPFLFVQLANWTVSDPKFTWPELREAQLMTLSLPKTGMAVAIDIGDPYDIHPKNKQEVGRRLALAAEAIAYGRDVVHSGPIYASMTVEGSKVRLNFKHTAGGLIARGAATLRGFEIAGEDRKFSPAQAVIRGTTIVVSSAQVARPVAVRYAWADNPSCNLYNKAGLPASPFRTDDWPSAPATNQ